ncbi:hypothetical protein F0225_02525 [Vibrio pectenicida]|uniref:Uncharacterized protein n=1 Tax=Vibrio pectenicida TaxID=62763 RepID=A0A7Y4EDE6_9VIBR|nr:hypothetical protein [Vibrio pectenicida]NOH70218.1 hypothetical protein [Vibrio pectenicida]
MPVGNSIHKAASLSNEGMNRAEPNETKRSLSEQIKNIEQKALSQNDKLESEKKSTFSWLKDLKSISQKHGDNSIVRFKNGQFKYGESSSRLKRLFNIDKTRIKSERQEAANHLTKLTSAKEESVTSKGLTNAIEKHLGTLEHKLETSLDKLDDLEQQLDSVKNEHLKAINEQWDSIPLPQNDSKTKKVSFAPEISSKAELTQKRAAQKQVKEGSNTSDASYAATSKKTKSAQQPRTNTVREIAAPTVQKLALSNRINQLQREIAACLEDEKHGARAAKPLQSELKQAKIELAKL